MNLKTFRVADMSEAMQMIKKEIGPDAVILSSRQVRKKKGFLGLFSKKELEVIAGYDEKKPKQPASNPVTFRSAMNQQAEQPAFVREPVVLTKNNDGVNERIDELKTMIEQLTKRVNGDASSKRYTPEIMEVYTRLTENDVNAEIADEICAETQEVCMVKKESPGDIAKSMIADMIGKPNTIKATKYKQKVVMLIGPTGVGKTTTLVKLAYLLVYQEKLNVGVINADSFRVAAQEHLKAYCDILKTDFITIYKPTEIKDALEAFKDKDIVLVDTAGKLSDDKEYRMDVAKLVSMGKIEDIYITLCASTADKVMKKTIDHYKFLKKYSIIITKMDEVSKKGVILNAAKFSGMPISYYTSGQNVPDDIAIISTQDVVESVLE